jgi:hypothetical protein
MHTQLFNDKWGSYCLPLNVHLHLSTNIMKEFLFSISILERDVYHLEDMLAIFCLENIHHAKSLLGITSAGTRNIFSEILSVTFMAPWHCVIRYVRLSILKREITGERPNGLSRRSSIIGSLVHAPHCPVYSCHDVQLLQHKERFMFASPLLTYCRFG